MTKVKTAMGKFVDIDSILKQNETTRAVGNVLMNARGDRIDSAGNIVIPVQQVARMQQATSEPTVSMSVDNLDNISEVVKEEKKAIIKNAKKSETKIVNQRTKTDISGNDITEVEYEDGSIEVLKNGDFE